MNVDVRVRNGIALERKYGFYREEGMESRESLWRKKKSPMEKKRAFYFLHLLDS